MSYLNHNKMSVLDMDDMIGEISVTMAEVTNFQQCVILYGLIELPQKEVDTHEVIDNEATWYIKD